MPSATLPRVVGADAANLFIGTFGIVLVLMAEALSAGRTFAAKHKYEINPNQELCAMGAANVASGLLGGMIVGGGMSGTAANDAGVNPRIPGMMRSSLRPAAGFQREITTAQ